MFPLFIFGFMSLIVPQERTDAKCPEYGEMASAGRPEKLPGSVCGSWPWRKSLARRSSMRREKGSKKKRKKREKKGAKKRRWKVSVRNAPLLEDNLRAGPVCFKSNQSIRINYPPPTPTPDTVQSSSRWHMDQRRLGCVLCFLSLCNNHTRPRTRARSHTHPTPTL